VTSPLQPRAFGSLNAVDPSVSVSVECGEILIKVANYIREAKYTAPCTHAKDAIT